MGGAEDDELAAAQDPADDRLSLYRYLAAPDRRAYLPIMRLFASTLLADLSAGEVAAALATEETAGRIEPGQASIAVVVPRLSQLVRWGNLVAGRRETVAASIAEFQHGGVRYQISKLGVRVQRDADALIRVPEGAREVSRELLPAIDRGLAALGEALAAALAEERRDPSSARTAAARDTLAEGVVTLFLQHAELAATVRDFYAYLGQVLTRFDLAPDEIAGFRNLLVEYIQLVVDDVLRHTPAIGARLLQLAGVRSELLRLLRSGSGLAGGELAGGGDVERSRGRTAAEWDELTGWFVDAPGRPSQVSALRQATGRAVGGLLAAVKRVTAGGSPRPARRSALLKLAGWFDAATPAQAHALYASAFGLYSARHLGAAPELDADNEHTRWQDGPLVEVTVSVRSRGERAAAGRGSRIQADPMGDELLRMRARDRADRRAAAVAELAAAAGRLPEANLSRPALDVLCELLGSAMAARDNVSEVGVGTDPVHHLRLVISPGEGPMQVSSVAGTLTVADARLVVEAQR
ncbi:MAG TPA: DUF2397 domain-containing protein [Mycobacteriales bacterium]|nr:DUF2397 domain-containing protein [Mycobacteriales bacterium]